MPDLPTCAHDVTLPPPGQESFCPLCLRARLAESEAEAARLAAVAQGRAEQLERVALYLGHVARHGPDGDRTIAGLAIQEFARLGAALAEAEVEIARLRAQLADAPADY